MPEPIDSPTKTESPSRRAPENYWQRHAPESRWRRKFNRRNVLDGFRTLLWIVPLTIFIWVYAERDQIRKDVDVDTSISVISSDRNRFVNPADDIPLKAILTLTGPQASVEKVRERLTSGIPRGVQIDIGDTLPPGRHQLIDVIDHMQNLPEFKDSGVTFTKSQPPQVIVDIDTITTQDADVTVPPGVDNLSSATFDPRKVHLRGPASVLKRLADQGNLKVYADILGSEVLRTPGKKDLASVPLTLSQPEERLTIEPPNVHAILDVRAADLAGIIDSVPIGIEALPAFLHGNEVALDSDTMANVRVIGPPDKVKLLESHDLPARAVLQLGDGPGTLKFEFPEGVRAAPGEIDRTVGFKVVRRENNG